MRGNFRIDSRYTFHNRSFSNQSYIWVIGNRMVYRLGDLRLETE